MQTIGHGWRYADLVPKAHVRELGDIKVQVLDLEAVIASKEDAGRDKDIAMLAVLRHTLAMREGKID